MYPRTLIYIVALAVLLMPAAASAYGQGYYEGYYQGYYQGSYVPMNTTPAVVIGRQYPSGSNFDGYIDEVRISDTARWTGASFTVPTSEYASDANTLLLLHMNDDSASHYYAAAGGYFAEPPPTGYKAVSTNNLPAPAVVKPVSYFDAKAYTGNAGSPSYDVANKGSYVSLSNNNFDASSVTNCCWANGLVYSGPTFNSGKWYAEFKITGNYPVTIGIGDASKRQTPEATLGYLPTEYSYYPYNGTIGNNNVFTGGYPGLTAGDVVMVAVDMSAGSIWFGKNGTWLGTGNPSTGTNPQYTGIVGTKAFAVDTLASAGTIQANFGQPGRYGASYYGAAGGYFFYSPPTGFLALPTVGSQNIGLVFTPDLVWVKNRTDVFAHTIVDSARGAGLNLFPNLTSAQVANDTKGSVMALYSPGFTAGGMCAGTTGLGNVSTVNNLYAAWAWNKSPTAGLDIVSYQGNGSPTQSITHALGTSPDLIITKRTDAVGDWFVWNSELSKISSPFGFVELNNQGYKPTFNYSQWGVYAPPPGTDAIPQMTAATTNGVTMTASTENQPAWWAGDKKGIGQYWDAYPNVPTIAAPQWLRTDFGAANQKTIGAYTLQNYYAGNSYQPSDFTLQGSNDATTCSAGTGVAGAVWTVLDTQSGVYWNTNGDARTFYVPTANQAAYRCYRLNITRTQDNNRPILEEFNLWPTTSLNSSSSFIASNQNGNVPANAPALGADAIPTMTAATTNGVTMSGSTEYQAAWWAGDKQGGGRYWDAYNNVPTVAAPQWLRTDFGAATQKTIAAYSLQAYYSGGANYEPTDFSLQASNDATTCSAAGAAWTTLDTETGIYWALANSIKTFYVPLANQAAYRCYRLTITRTQDGNRPILEEFNLWQAAGGQSSQYVSYVFANREGFQKSGVYVGNGNSTYGPTVYTGFKPRFVMIKDVTASTTNARWNIYDSARDSASSTETAMLYPDAPFAEGQDGYCNATNCPVLFLSNGFKVLSAGYWNTNNSGDRYLYLAFAEIPFKTASEPNGTSLTSALRFDSNANGYLSRNLSSLGNRKIHTFSAWIKRGTLGTEQAFFTANTGAMDDNSFLEYKFNASDQIVITGGSTVFRQTLETFRDTSKWYHVVIAVDTTIPDDAGHVAANNRIHLYVNGREIKTFWCVDHVCKTP